MWFASGQIGGEEVAGHGLTDSDARAWAGIAGVPDHKSDQAFSEPDPGG